MILCTAPFTCVIKYVMLMMRSPDGAVNATTSSQCACIHWLNTHIKLREVDMAAILEMTIWALKKQNKVLKSYNWLQYLEAIVFSFQMKKSRLACDACTSSSDLTCSFFSRAGPPQRQYYFFPWTGEHGTFNERKVSEMKSRLMRYLGCFSVNKSFSEFSSSPTQVAKAITVNNYLGLSEAVWEWTVLILLLRVYTGDQRNFPLACWSIV